MLRPAANEAPWQSPRGLSQALLFPIGGAPGIDVDQKGLRWHARGPQMPRWLAKNCLASMSCPGQAREQACGRGQTSCSNCGGNPTRRPRVWPYDLVRGIPKFRGWDLLLHLPRCVCASQLNRWIERDLRGIRFTVGRHGQAPQCLGRAALSALNRRVCSSWRSLIQFKVRPRCLCFKSTHGGLRIFYRRRRYKGSWLHPATSGRRRGPRQCW
jgi:hypothetical protein